MNLNSHDVLKYILRSRIAARAKGKKFNIFNDWSYRQILWQINEAIKQKLILIVYSEQNQLLGIALGRRHPNLLRGIHILCVVADSKLVLQTLIHGAKEHFNSGEVFTALKNGNKKHWNSVEDFQVYARN